MPKKFGKERGEAVSRFSVEKIFRLTVPKKLVREPFSLSLFSGMEKSFCFRGLCHDFRFSVDNFLSHSAKEFRRGTLSCFTNFGYRKGL